MIEVTSRQKVSGFNLTNKIEAVIEDYLADHYAGGDALGDHMTGAEFEDIASRVTAIVVGETQSAMRSALQDWATRHDCDNACVKTIPTEDAQPKGTPNG